MGVCDSATTKVDSTTSAISSATNAISSIKNLLNDTIHYTQFASNTFDKYDKKKSGYIEQAELKVVINDMASHLNKSTNIDEEKVKKALETIDTDKDGKISKEEFIKISREKLLAAFN